MIEIKRKTRKFILFLVFIFIFTSLNLNKNNKVYASPYSQSVGTELMEGVGFLAFAYYMIKSGIEMNIDNLKQSYENYKSGGRTMDLDGVTWNSWKYKQTTIDSLEAWKAQIKSNPTVVMNSSFILANNSSKVINVPVGKIVTVTPRKVTGDYGSFYLSMNSKTYGWINIGSFGEGVFPYKIGLGINLISGNYVPVFDENGTVKQYPSYADSSIPTFSVSWGCRYNSSLTVDMSGFLDLSQYLTNMTLGIPKPVANDERSISADVAINLNIADAENLSVDDIVGRLVSDVENSISVNFPTSVDYTSQWTGLFDWMKKLLDALNPLQWIEAIKNLLEQIRQFTSTFVNDISVSIGNILSNQFIQEKTKDINQRGLPDLFNFMILIILALIRLLLACINMLINLQAIPPDASLINPYMRQAIEFLKTYQLYGFNLSFFDLINTVVFSVQAFGAIKILRKYIHREFSG